MQLETANGHTKNHADPKQPMADQCLELSGATPSYGGLLGATAGDKAAYGDAAKHLGL